jgi:hypothetical protein
LGERGYSKDHRPELMQMIVGVVIDATGRPVCSEMWPGNTADVSVLVPVIDRLRRRFGIGRVCVVADRGMISAPTIAALEVSISLIPPCVSVHSATCDGFSFADLGVRRPALGGQTVSDQGCRLGLWGSPVKPASIRRRRTGPR